MGIDSSEIRILPAGSVSPGRISQCLSAIGRDDLYCAPTLRLDGWSFPSCLHWEEVAARLLYNGPAEQNSTFEFSPSSGDKA